MQSYRDTHDWTAIGFFFLLLLLTGFSCKNLAAQNNANSFEDLAAAATAAREANRAPQAIELYKQALLVNPDWQEGWWSLGLLQYRAEDYAAATESLSHFLTQQPDDGEALALRGLCEFETGEYAQSLEDIRKGLTHGAEEDAQHKEILRYHEAMLLTRLGSFEAALKAYAPFAEQGLSSPELFVAIGIAALRMPLLPKQTAADQKELLSAVGEATFRFMAGDQKAAQSAFEDLFRRFPTARTVHYHYGNLLMAFGPEAAAPQFKKELDVAPDNADALAMLAWSLLLEDRPEEALPYAKRVAQEKPELAASQLVYGRALVGTGSMADGIEHLRKGLKLEPNNLEVHIALAKAFSKSGREEEARRERALCMQMTRNVAAHP